MKTKFLLLWFEAPLQSWGADSKFGRRETLPFPTKSGVAGLLLSALGASGEQRELLEFLAPLKQTIISCVRKSFKEKQEEKTEREPLLRDFHMVGGGYDENKKWQAMNIPKKKDGGKAVGGGTKLTYRYYLQDAKFAVVVEIPDDLADNFSLAMQNPVYDIYLGRKNCVPTDFVYRGIFDDEKAALDFAKKIILEKGNLIEDFLVIDGENEDGDTSVLTDVPVQFGEFKKYKDRKITVLRL
ncbi:MAG: type I-E CRISPR-associated protein Cas5/CasD [Candidatus Omnitrophota bacterium]